MKNFWSIQEIIAFFIAVSAAFTIIWKISRQIIKQSILTHSKVEAIEELLDQVNANGMTTGAAEAIGRFERRLLITQAQIRVIMEVDGTGYVETDADGGLIYCNSQFTHWTGMNSEEASGYGWASAVHIEDRARIINEWSSAVKEKRPIDLWYRYKHANIEIPVHARSVVIRNDNEVLGYLALIVPV